LLEPAKQCSSLRRQPALLRTPERRSGRRGNDALPGSWKVGQRIRQDILNEKRAAYGQEILSTLSGKLVAELGRGFSQQNLFRMVDFAEAFPDPQIVATLSKELG